MKMSRWLVVGGFSALLVLSSAQAAMAYPPGGPLPHCPIGYTWDDNLGQCVKNPPPGHSPVLFIDGDRQTVTRDGIHLWGWTADADSPLTSLTVGVSVDGGARTTALANLSRPDVAAAYPQYGAYHGYDLVVPASAAGHNVCVSAVNVGGGADTTSCAQMDDIVSFDANAVAYDTAHAVITPTGNLQLDSLDVVNGSSVDQTTSLNRSTTVTDTHSWSDSATITVTADVKVGIPLLADGKVSVQGSDTYTQNGSGENSTTFTWNQQVIVPAHSEVRASVAVTQFKLVVPYTLTGSYIYRSGATAPGTLSGTYSGIDSTNLYVTITQYNLDGTLAANPVAQPSPSLKAATQ